MCVAGRAAPLRGGEPTVGLRGIRLHLGRSAWGQGEDEKGDEGKQATSRVRGSPLSLRWEAWVAVPPASSWCSCPGKPLALVALGLRPDLRHGEGLRTEWARERQRDGGVFVCV